MKTNTIKLAKPLLLVTAMLMIITYGCKKSDLKNTAPVDEKTLDILRADVAKQMEHVGGMPQEFTRNQKVTTQWVDQSRNPVTKEQMQNNNFTSQCNYDLPAYCDLVQYARVYRCGATGLSAGYFLQFEYEISWNNNITNIGGTAGYADIVDGSNNTVQSLAFDYTNSDVEIVEIGPDPNPSFPNNYIFRVKFVTTDFSTHLVPEAYINSGSYDVKFSATFGTDCKAGGSPYSLWLLPVTTYGFTGSSGYDPCERNDKAYVSTAPGSSAIMTVAGYNAGGFVTCSFGGSFVAADLQEVQYDVDGGGWTNMDNFTATGLGIANSAFVRGIDFCQTATLPSGTGHLVTLRYRNFRYNTAPPSNWPLPTGLNTLCKTYANMSLPSGQQDYSTWAYSYWAY